ncbi:MAG: spermidine/putrescine ABC transporter substrate-binding protein [Lentisphaeria bacterium]|nr:spermidine/putrescine ABC transporter substrate-binding protein [Lentisphaeria bacterium]
MKHPLVSCTLALIAVVCLVSCGKPKQTLHIYNWGDYLADSVIEKFEKEFDCKVKVDVFDSNEAMYAKLKAGAGGYDIVVPSSYMAKPMYEQGMIRDLDISLLPNVKQYFDQSYKDLCLDKDMTYTVPYFCSFTGIGYDPEKVPDFEPSWHMFEKASIVKHCSLLNDQRETIGAALLTLGYDVNSTDQAQIDAAVELVNKWKKNIAKFEVDDAKRALATGEFYLVHNYSGDMIQVSMEKPNIKFVIPKEGGTVTFDCFAIMSNSPNAKLAHDFINFMYRPDISAENMNEIGYVSPNTEAVKLVSDDMKDNPIFNLPAEERARCKPLLDLGADNEKYTKAWDKIREE